MAMTISNGDDVTPTAGVVMMGVITYSNGDDADTESRGGDDWGDHHQQWR